MLCGSALLRNPGGVVPSRINPVGDASPPKCVAGKSVPRCRLYALWLGTYGVDREHNAKCYPLIQRWACVQGFHVEDWEVAVGP